MKQEAIYMQQLLETPGWKILEKRLNEERHILGEQILSGKCVTRWEEDLLRMKRLNIEFLLNYPAALATAYADDTPEPNVDSYLTVEELELIKRQEQSH